MSRHEGGDAPALDAYWLGVIEFLARHSVAPSRTLAPREFGPYLEHSIPYELAADTDVSGLDCAVFHKGMLARLPARFLWSVLRRLLPSYANAVFVVYCREIFEPLVSAEHIKAFLAKVPDEAEAPPSSPPPLAVYAGQDRIICRDPDFRKIIIPSRERALLGALTGGRNLVAELTERLAPVLAGARRIVDYGAGIGLLALAAKEKAAHDCMVAAIEDDAVRIRCLNANIDLAGLYWRVEVMTERPQWLGDIGRDAGASAGTVWLAQNGPSFDLAVPCDVLHVDLDFAREDGIVGIAAFLDENGCPPVVLSRSLAGRAGEGPGADEATVVTSFQSLGYGAEVHDIRAGLGTLTVLRSTCRNASI
ncbi:MAG: hypothetical protein J0H34_01915 [Rhizobiales bacterium]|nr:hypothetical protein [Hyphomicrobiales bacterium]